MIITHISLPTALTWLGSVLTLLGLLLTALGYLINHNANKKMTDLTYAIQNMDRAIEKLQGGALDQLLRQHERFVANQMGDSDSSRQIMTSENGNQIDAHSSGEGSGNEASRQAGSHTAFEGPSATAGV